MFHSKLEQIPELGSQDKERQEAAGKRDKRNGTDGAAGLDAPKSKGAELEAGKTAPLERKEIEVSSVQSSPSPKQGDLPRDGMLLIFTSLGSERTGAGKCRVTLEPGGAGRAEGAPGSPAPAVLGCQNKGWAFAQMKMEGKWEKLIAWLVAQHLVQQQLLMACWDAKLEQWIFKSVASTGVRTGLSWSAPVCPGCPPATPPPSRGTP